MDRLLIVWTTILLQPSDVTVLARLELAFKTETDNLLMLSLWKGSR